MTRTPSGKRTTVRMWHWRSNPPRRHTDVIEAWIVLVTWTLTVLVGVLAGVVAAQAVDSGLSAQAARAHAVTARPHRRRTESSGYPRRQRRRAGVGRREMDHHERNGPHRQGQGLAGRPRRHARHGVDGSNGPRGVGARDPHRGDAGGGPDRHPRRSLRRCRGPGRGMGGPNAARSAAHGRMGRGVAAGRPSVGEPEWRKGLTIEPVRRQFIAVSCTGRVGGFPLAGWLPWRPPRQLIPRRPR